ncbi:transposase [Cryptosporangium minutisporangium]|uniref:Transposase n=1 Tax=Cryptosporangium minutisporangium TaxID=113569 RepID=A0ABP6T3J8_9ACTN
MTLAQVARDFGVHEMTLSKWMRQADVEDGVKPGVTTDQAAELRELRRRNRLLERNIVRDEDFTCALCESALPAQWNFATK